MLRSKYSDVSIPTPVSIDQPLLPDTSFYCPQLLSIYTEVKSPSPMLLKTTVLPLNIIKAGGFGIVVGAFCFGAFFFFFLNRR